LILHNWFAQYQTISGLRMILKQMEQRTRFPSNLAASTKDLEENYSYFEGQFFEFMSALISFTKTKTITL
ncbi:acyl carrier protein phosphodiesterase, partial [Flavobacteriaceae bacterium]|nr:acyl carrier protein phosphodiesterase [Flavobacteriaceae bacterium]